MHPFPSPSPRRPALEIVVLARAPRRPELARCAPACRPNALHALPCRMRFAGWRLDRFGWLAAYRCPLPGCSGQLALQVDLRTGGLRVKRPPGGR